MNREEAIRKVENYLASYFPIEDIVDANLQKQLNVNGENRLFYDEKQMCFRHYTDDETMIQKIRRGKRNDGCKVY